MFGDDLRDIILLHHRVECALRINDHDRAQGAEAEASCLYNSYFLGKSVCINLFMQSVDDPLAARGGTSCSAADKYM